MAVVVKRVSTGSAVRGTISDADMEVGQRKDEDDFEICLGTDCIDAG